MSLGKGLSALIAPTSRKKTVYTTGEDNKSQQRIWMVPLSEIQPNPAQPRRHFATAELQELAESIKEHGILQPLLVEEKNDGGYQIVAGERRWRAAQMVSLTEVPVIVKQLADREKLEVALVENIQREDLNPIEEAFAYKRLIEEFGLTQQQVAEKVGKSRPAVANAVRLLELPEPAQKALIEKQITSGQARAILSIENTAQQLEILESMRGEKITVRELEREAVKRSGKDTSRRRDPNLLYLEEKLRAALGTKVHITQKGNRGSILIDYYSKDELASIIQKIIPN